MGDKKSTTKNAQSAILEYYDDLLGSLANDPLQKLIREEREQTANANKPISRQQHNASKVSVQRKKKTVAKTKAVLFKEPYEAKPIKEILSPLIIPAAFPKLAPAKTVVLPEVKEQLRKEKKSIEPAAIVISKEVIGSERVVKSVPIVKPAVTEPVKVKQEESSSAELIKPQKHISEQEIKNKPVPVVETDLAPKFKSSSPAKSEQLTPDTWLKNGRPSWAQDRFECLLFSVAGLQLAVPLVSLGAVYKIENDFTPLIGRASWFMGLYRHDSRNVRVIDTAQLVMPDRVTATTRDKYHYIIRLGGNNWGIACDSIQEAIQLEPSEVKWRTERSKRAWLSGTVIEHMCALIDADALSRMLKQEALLKHSAFSY